MLIVIDELLKGNELKHAQSELAHANWQAGHLSAGQLAAPLKTNLQLDDRSDISRNLASLILGKVNQHPSFISAALPDRIYPPKFNCYQNNAHYGQHIDSAIMRCSDGSQMRSDLSATLFLSNADDYAGGELCIELSGGVQEVKLNAGDMLLYPANCLHEVKPVTAGKRLASFFWVQSLIRDQQLREYLFELDQNIQVLILKLGRDDEQVKRLSALYHNFLRQLAFA